MPETDTIKRRFHREYARMRRRLERECDLAGACCQIPLQVFAEAAAEVETEIASCRGDGDSEHVTRQRARHALRSALAAGRDAIRPDKESSHTPASGDVPMLEDVLLAVDSLVILLERETYRPRFAPRMRTGDRSAESPVHRWRGADVRIAEAPYPSYSGSSTLVVTEHAAALAGLFLDLRDLAAPGLDHMTKYEFFGRMAEAAKTWLAKQPGTDQVDLLLVAAREARNVVEDWLARVEHHERNPRPWI